MPGVRARARSISTRAQRCSHTRRAASQSDKTELDGSIYLPHGAKLEVSKTLAHLEGSGQQVRVQTTYFRYHAMVSAPQANVFRYDSKTDRPYPHKHTYDTFGTGEVVSVDYLQTPHDIPSLKTVIEELYAWSQANRRT